MEDQDLPLSMDVEFSSSDTDMDEAEEHLIEQPEISSPYAALSNTSKEDITRAGDNSFLRMRTLMDVDPPEGNVEENFVEKTSLPPQERQETVKPKTTGSYRRYTPHQIESSLILLSKKARLQRSSANYWDKRSSCSELYQNV